MALKIWGKLNLLYDVDYLVEGRSDEPIARRLIFASGGVPGLSLGNRRTGKSALDRRLPGLNAGISYRNPIVVLRDLDFDAECPSQLIANLLPNKNEKLMLRICVREAEAWLIADHDAYARYCGGRGSSFPTSPEELNDPKSTLLSLAHRGKAPSLKRHLDETRIRGVPDWASLGEWNSEFAERRWDPIRAASTGICPSLSRSMARIRAVLHPTLTSMT